RGTEPMPVPRASEDRVLAVAEFPFVLIVPGAAIDAGKTGGGRRLNQFLDQQAAGGILAQFRIVNGEVEAQHILIADAEMRCHPGIPCIEGGKRALAAWMP